MKLLYCFYPLWFLSAWLYADAAPFSTANQPQLGGQMEHIGHTVFIENRGQWNSQALFCLPSPEITVWGTARGLVYDYQRADADGEHIRGQIVRMEFGGALLPSVLMQNQTATEYNYFRGRDSSQWVSGVPGSREVLYRTLYSNVDMRLYIDNGMPRYDLLLDPGADVSAIVLRFRGMTSLTVGDKELRLRLNERDIVQGGLFAYQIEHGERREVPCRFVQYSDGGIGFELGSYDHSRPLVIDPLVYSTFIGGVLGDEGYGIALDASGNTYITGTTLAQNYPVTTGAYNTTKSGGIDIVVSKINAIGSDLIYSTFIGGNDDDFGYDIAVDAFGRAAITGCSFSADFPVTTQAFDGTLSGDRDVVVVRLSESGSRLDGSTFLGGNNWDEGYSVAVDAAGTVYVTGMTTSSDFPTANAFDNSYNGAQDAFVARLSRDVSSLQLGSFLGGASGDQGNAIAIDNNGAILIAGTTGSNDFLTTGGAFDRTFNGNVGTTDAFVAKVSAGGGLVFSTYLGGSDNEEGRGIAADALGGVIVGGWTSSPTPGFPITAGVYDSELNGIDAFFARLNSSGTALQVCTYFGQLGADAITDIAVDAAGMVYAVGYTLSSTLPTTPGAHDTTFNGGNRDAFLIKFAPSFTPSSFLYGTYLGGNNYDEAKSLVVDSDGNASIAGVTRSGNFPTTIGAISRNFAGMSDAFVSKIGTGVPQIFLMQPTGGETWCAGSVYKITWRSRSVTYVRIELSSNGGVSYPVVLADSIPAFYESWGWLIPLSITPGSQYRVRVVNIDNEQIKDATKTNFSIHAPPVITRQPQPITACVGVDATFRIDLTAFPAATVQWQYSSNGVDWLDVPAPAGLQNPLVLTNVQLAQHNLQYRMIAQNSCNTSGVISSTATLSVRAQPRVLTAPIGVSVCEGGDATLGVVVDEPGVSYQWRRDGKALAGATSRELAISNASSIHTGTYDVVVTGACPPSVISTAATVSVQLPPDVSRVPVFRSILCHGETRDTTLTLTNNGPIDITAKIVSISNPRFTVISPVGDFIVPSHGDREIGIRFTPTRAEFEQAELVLSTTPCNHEVRVSFAARADSVRLATADVAFEAMSQCDTARTAVVRLVNSGTVSLPVHRALFSDPGFSLVSPALPFTVKSNGGWVDAVVRFADDGVVPAVLAKAEFISDTCTGISAVSNLSVRRDRLSHKPSQAKLDFGTMSSCDSHVDKSFLLFNTGTAPITIDSMAIDNAAFGVVKPAVGFSVRPGEYAELTVRFSGGSDNLATGRLVMYESVCGVASSIELRGARAGSSLIAGTATVNMGSYLLCQRIPDTTFTMINLDAEAVIIERVRVDAPFEIVSPSFPATIARGDSLRVTVRVVGGLGTLNGQAEFDYHTGKCSSSVAVALAASRLQPAATLAPAEILPLELGACDEYRDTIVVLHNDGPVAITLDRVEGSTVVSALTPLPIVVKPGRTTELLLRARPDGSATGKDTLWLHIAECDTAISLVVDVRKPGASFSLSADKGGDTLYFDTVFNCGEQTSKRRFRVDVAFAKDEPVDVAASVVSVSPPGPFSVALASGAKLGAGEQWFDVEFVPIGDGSFTSVMSVTFMPCGITKKLVFKGRKLYSRMIPPAPVDFGIVQQGGSRMARIVYRNEGSAAVDVGALVVDAPFVVVSTKPDLPAHLEPGDSVQADIEYTAGDGMQQGKAVLRLLQPCADSVFATLTGKGQNIPTTILTGLALDFGDVLVNAPAQLALSIYNQGAADAVLYGTPLLAGADASEFSLVTLPIAVIPPGGSTSFDIGFLPLSTGDKKAVCRIDYNGVRLDIDLSGRGVERGPVSSAVFLPDTSATPFTRGLRLPITLVPGENFTYALVDSFAAVIRFNASLFLPTGVEHAVIIGDTTLYLDDVSERVLTIIGRHRDTAELCALVGDVLLGDAISTPLNLSFQWLKPGVIVQAQYGKLTLEGVREGALLRSKGMPGFVVVGPNPAQESASVEIRAIEDGEHYLELFDMTGKKIWATSWPRVSTGRLGTVYTFSIPVAQFSSGSYSLVYKAPGGYVDKRTLVVVH